MNLVRIYMKKYFLLYTCLSCLFFTVFIQNIAHAQTVQATKTHNWQGEDGATGTENVRVYIKDIFRIFYYTSGENKVGIKDLDANNIPDYVEDVSKQLWATQYLFCQIYGFRSPLDSPLYAGVESIDVYIIHRNNMKELLGVAFTDPVPAPLKKKGSLALKIFVSKGLDFTHSTTVTHEYFHLIQGGMSKIRNKWYLEGLARWSENGLMKKNIYVEPKWNLEKLLKSQTGLSLIQTSSYNSGKLFWHPIGVRFGGAQHIRLEEGDVLLNLKYSNGASVLQDTIFPGANLMRDFLVELGKEDANLEEKFKYISWDNKESRHVQNNTYILNALKRTLEILRTP